MGDMHKKVDIPPFEIAADVGHGKKVAERAWRFKSKRKEECQNPSGIDLRLLSQSNNCKIVNQFRLLRKELDFIS